MQDPTADLALLSSTGSVLGVEGLVTLEPGTSAQVQIVTSQQVSGSPILRLQLPDGSTAPISLTNSNATTWLGNLAIPSTMTAGIGTFDYFATGVSGSTSASIVSGQNLIVGNFPQTVPSGDQDVILLASKELAAPPTVYMTAPGGGISQVNLSNPSGDGVTWLSEDPVNFATQYGTATFALTAMDRTGNLSNEIVSGDSFIVDSLAPGTLLGVSTPSLTVGATVYMGPGSRITLSGTDPSVGGWASGLSYVQYSVDGGIYAGYQSPFALAEGSHTVTYRSADRAGNVEIIRSSRIVTDLSAPSVQISSPSAGARFTSSQELVRISFSMGDTYDAAPSSRAYLSNGTTTLAVTSGQEISPFSIPSGSWTLTVSATDFIGNSVSSTTAPFWVFHDTLTPRTSLGFSGLQYLLSGSTYIARQTMISLPSVDDAESVGDALGGGIQESRYSVNSATSYAIYSAPFSLAAGSYTLRFFSRDMAGNLESTQTAVVYVDTQPPATTLLTGATFYSDGSALYARLDQTYGFQSLDSNLGEDIFLETFSNSDLGRWQSVFGTWSVSSGTMQNALHAMAKTLRTDFSKDRTVTLKGKVVQPGGSSWHTEWIYPKYQDDNNYVLCILHLTGWLEVDVKKSGANDRYDIYAGATPTVQNSFKVVTSSQNLQVWINDVKYADINNSKVNQLSGGMAVRGEGSVIQVDDVQVRSTFYTPASGLKRIFAQVDGGVDSVYQSSITFNTEGTHTIVYHAEDNVGNSEINNSIAVKVDATPPSSYLVFSASPVVIGTMTFVSTSNAISVVSNDPLSANVRSGMKSLQVMIGTSSASLFLNITTPTITSSTFTLSPGQHTVSFYGRDNVGNQETAQVRTIVVNKPAPVVSIASPLGGMSFSRNNIQISFSVTDPYNSVQSSGAYIASASTRIAVWSGQQIDPFTLPAGSWTLTVGATDYLGNSVSSTTAPFWVYHDTLTPRTSLGFSGSKYILAGSTYIARQTSISLPAVDDESAVGDGLGAGIQQTRYSVNSATSFATYSAPFSLSAGSYTLRFFSKDMAGNSESTQTAVVFVDTQPPTTTLLTGTTLYSDGSNFYARLDQTYGLVSIDTNTADDTFLDSFSGGLGNWQSVFGTWFTTAGVMQNNLHAMTKTVRQDFSTDRTVSLKGKVVQPGGSSWHTEWIYPKYQDDSNYILCVFHLTGWLEVDVKKNGANDRYDIYAGATPTVQGSFKFVTSGSNLQVWIGDMKKAEITNSKVAQLAGRVAVRGEGSVIQVDDVQVRSLLYTPSSGLKRILARLDGGADSLYASSITFITEGAHSISYHGEDNVENPEQEKTFNVRVDTTAPQSRITVASGPGYTAGPQIFVGTSSVLALSANDPVSNGVASGVKMLQYRLDAGSYQSYASSFSIASGAHTVSFFGTDNAGNSEGVQSVNVTVDTQPPATAIAFGPGSFAAFDRRYVSPLCPLGLEGADSASGVSRTEFALDEGGFQNYVSSFTLAQLLAGTTDLSQLDVLTGTHTVRFRSFDNLGNAEILNQIAVFVNLIPEYALVGSSRVFLNNHSQVTGSLRTNGSAVLNASSVVTGSILAQSVDVQGQSQVTGQVTSSAPAINPSPMDLVSIASQAAFSNNNSSIPWTQNGFNPLDGNLKLTVRDNDVLALSSGTYYFSAIEIMNNSRVNVSTQASIFCSGSVTISSASKLNAGGDKRNLALFVASGTFVLDTNSEIAGIVVAPESTVEVKSGSRLTGHVFAKEGWLDEGVISVESSTQTQGGGGGMGAPSLTVQIPKPTSPADFVLGEYYSFPNPAVGSKRPTLHLECGLADSVDIRIYDIAGDLVHQMRLEQNPQIIGGPSTPLGAGKYAYEYSWDTSGIASGVYIYVMVAKKAGEQDIKVMKKLAVIK